MNQKAFNLFTALISFLLIMLAVLLIMSMIQTERNAADTIARIESRSRLEATAEMARADAMQVFNYALRKKIEDWLTDPERGGLTLQLHNKTWKEIQDEFAASKFGGEEGSQFAKFTASSMEGIFYSPSHFGNYTISLEGSTTLETAINKVIAKSLDDFFTVIECPDGDPRDCEKGTFYVNLHLERLTQEEYESLPKLYVIDSATGEELKEIILPRTTFRIYVPLRFFKAIAEAKALTHFPLETEPDSPQDKGLFSPRVHNEIELFGLGMCDYGSCAPRTNPSKPPLNKELTGEGTFCPGDGTSPDWSKGLPTTLESDKPWFPVGLTVYNANNNDDWRDMKNTLVTIGSAKACDVIGQARAAGYIDADPNDLFTLVGNDCLYNEEMLAYDITINVDTRDSKLIGTTTGGQSQNDPGRNLGLYWDGDKQKVDYPHVGGIEFLGCSGMQGDYISRCAEVKSVKVTLAFREEDPNYMVREAKEGEQRIYRISLYDNTYVPFTANWEQGEMNPVTFLYSKAPEITNCSALAGEGWHCVSTLATGDPPPGGQGPQTVGCKPPVLHADGAKPTEFDDD